MPDVAPVRERGLKWKVSSLTAGYNRRSREGAWIEIIMKLLTSAKTSVAPVRERGLKFGSALGAVTGGIGRSREGAWIEIAKNVQLYINGWSLP